MTVTLELTPAEEARLAEAVRLTGLPRAEAAHSVLAEHLPPVDTGENDPTLALFAQWDAEDAAMTAEAAEAEQQLWGRFESNVNETRQAQNMRLLSQATD